MYLLFYGVTVEALRMTGRKIRIEKASSIHSLFRSQPGDDATSVYCQCNQQIIVNQI